MSTAERDIAKFLSELHQRLENTMIYVTHDQIEAMTLADRIVVLREGLIEQVGTPRELYESPANLFVAQFIGSPRMNVLPATAVAGRLAARLNVRLAEGVGMRPEHISLTAPEAGLLRGRVVLSEYTGAATLLHVELEEAGTALVIANGPVVPEVGQEVGLEIAREHLHVFDKAGRAIRPMEQAA
jgi:ABC-type sugar transport system ATPase subunit